MLFCIPNYVLNVISAIENAGGEAYLVGGCVRDMLLNIPPCDFDITTSLAPEKIINIFSKTVATGLKHGTVTVITDGGNIEVTTYRTDGAYQNNRHPKNVEFIGSLKEDLARRDFTVNAIAYNPKTGIIDIFGGLNDIKAKILRTVGSAEIRFNEDALRILRLIRFSAQLDFTIEKATLESALKLSYLLKNISRERIASELFKALLSKKPQNISMLTEAGALSFCKITKGSISKDISLLPKNREIRFYKFLYDLKSNHQIVCKELKTDKFLLNFCEEVNKAILLPLNDIVSVKRAMKDYSKNAVFCAMLILNKDTSLIEKIEKSNQPYKINHLKISGKDLNDIGITGVDNGKALNKLVEFVIENPNGNNRETLLSLLK